MLLRSRLAKIAVGAGILVLSLLGVYYWHGGRPFRASPGPTDPDAALAELRSGNARFVSGARTLSTDTAHDGDQRHNTAQQQHPFAVVLCCADSRVCPEFIFDQREGSIFVLRNAGNLADEAVVASFEYAVEHFHVPLLLVVGHKGCGAVRAVYEAGDQPLPDRLGALQKLMSGLHADVIRAREHPDADALDRLSRENAQQQAQVLLRDSHILKTAVDQGKARLMCGIYDMESGVVEFFRPE